MTYPRTPSFKSERPMSTVNNGKVVGGEDPEKAERRRRRDPWRDLKAKKPWIKIESEARTP